MVLDIFTGNKFSRLKLIFGTNKFFGDTRFKKLITDKNSNFVVKIGNHSVKIIASNNATERDIRKVKNYIEKMFKDCSILIESTESLQWLNDIKNVSIHNLNKTK